MRSRAAVEPVLQDAPAHREVGRGNADDDAALHARAHPLVDPLELGRRPVGGHHHLLAAVEQRVEHVAELLLHRLAGQELHVVDQQDVDRPQLFLEVERGAVAQRADELDREALDGQVERPPPGSSAAPRCAIACRRCVLPSPTPAWM